MTAANSLQVVAAALNLQQTLTGSFQSPGGNVVNGGPAGVWRLDPNQFALFDVNGVRRVASGNLPANGVSPAGFKFEADDQNGNPIFDSFGLIAVANQLGRGDTLSVTGYTTNVPTLIPGATFNFTLARTVRLRVDFAVWGVASGSAVGQVEVFLDGNSQAAISPGVDAQLMFQNTFGDIKASFWSDHVAGGSHTLDLHAYNSAGLGTFSVQGATIIGWSMGA